jgi:TPP-dependent pyruvate/acetoin dehydrogenase alpha subunit
MVAATGVTSEYVDGRDVTAVVDSVDTIVDSVRLTGRPAFVECGVFRVRPHSLSDPDYRYRPRESGDEWLRLNDPIARLREQLEPDFRAVLDEIDSEVDERVRAAVAAAEAAPPTSAAAAREHIYATSELGDA